MVHGGRNVGCDIYTFIDSQLALVAMSNQLWNSAAQPSNAGFLVASVGPANIPRYTLVAPLGTQSGSIVAQKFIGTVDMQPKIGPCPLGAFGLPVHTYLGVINVIFKIASFCTVYMYIH
jgi:hypothetical protein